MKSATHYRWFFLLLTLLSACDRVSLRNTFQSGDTAGTDPTTADTGRTVILRPPGPGKLVFEGEGVIYTASLKSFRFDFGEQSIRSINDARIVLRNIGLGPVSNLTLSGISTPYSIEGGSTCSTSLAANTSCTLYVRYVPTDNAIHQQELSADGDDGLDGRVSAKLNLAGKGDDVASLRFSRSLTNFIPLNTNESIEFDPTQDPSIEQVKTVGVFYYGTFKASGLAFTNVSAPFRMELGSCNSIELETNCVLTIRYKGVDSGIPIQNIGLTYFNGSGTTNTLLPLLGHFVKYHGVGTGIVFPRVEIGRDTSITVKSSLDASLPLTIDPATHAKIIDASDAGIFSITNTNCGPTIQKPTFTGCASTIRFTPNAVKQYTAKIAYDYSFIYNGVTVTRRSTHSISGWGANPGAVAQLVEPNTYTFQNESVGCSPPSLDFTVRHTGTADTGTILLKPITTTAGFSQEGSGCGVNTSLAPGATCILRLRAKPLLVGANTGTVTVSYSVVGTDAPVQSFSFDVHVTGESAIKLAIEQVPLNFGNTHLATVSKRPIVIRHCGVGLAPITNMSITGSDAPLFSFDPSFPGATAPNLTIGGVNYPLCSSAGVTESCYAQVQFLAPIGTAPGPKSANLQFSFSEAATVSITGGLAAAVLPPTQPAPSPFPVSVAVNGGHSCGITSNREVKCWGRNDHNQVGVTPYGSYDAAFKLAFGLGSDGNAMIPKKVALGQFHSCVLSETGDVICWGRNEFGQLGTGDFKSYGGGAFPLNTARPITLGQRAIDLALGHHYSCALLEDHAVKCWGHNGEEGHLGLGNEAHTNLPTASVNLGEMVPIRISAKAGHTCALDALGRAKCWGGNFYGQLGTAIDEPVLGVSTTQMGNNLPFVDLGAGRSATSIEAGSGFTCAVLDTGVVKCFGRNYTYERFGPLGALYKRNPSTNEFALAGTPGYTADSDWMGRSPEEMDALQSVDFGSAVLVNTVSSGGLFSCVVTGVLPNHLLKCFGNNTDGMLGLGDTLHRGENQSMMGDALPFVQLGQNLKVKSVAAGTRHSCVVVKTLAGIERVKCWGFGGYSALGVGGSSTQSKGSLPAHMGDALPFVANFN